jgi:spermidine/putrescine transport system substrate-binding protein
MKNVIESRTIAVAIVLFWFVCTLALLFSGNLQWNDERTLNVCSWVGIFDPAAVSLFEKETGIKVKLSHYTSNEELMVMMNSTGGVGYDVIVPSDYAVMLLKKNKLLKVLDHTKLSFFGRLNPHLMGHAFDEDNRYSIPYAWEIFGFGIDTLFFGKQPLPALGWDAIFDASQNFKIIMTNDPIEAVLFAVHYLYGVVHGITEDQIRDVKRVLKEQRSRINAYTNFRADYYLITRNCPLVVTSSSHIVRALQKDKDLAFVVPEDGTFATIENITLVAASQHEDEAYQFINFMYRKELVSHHVQLFGYLPAVTDIDEVVIPLDQKRFQFFYRPMSEAALQDLWIEVKST